MTTIASKKRHAINNTGAKEKGNQSVGKKVKSSPPSSGHDEHRRVPNAIPEHPPLLQNDYAGYSLQTSSLPTETIDLIGNPSNLKPQDFFEQYIRQRKPCQFNGLPTIVSNDVGVAKPFCTTTSPLLEQLAGDHMIQVERRFHRSENFGQNRTAQRQVQLSIRDFLRKLLDDTDDDSNELYYWSTQEDTCDPYNVPCRQLLNHGHIPTTIPQAGHLILSSCNLWMGSSSEGASSGLHHDYHDNFYLLLEGKKRFRLMSPDCAPLLHVYGNIHHIHANGRISYVGNETRADGVPCNELNVDDGEDEEEDDEEGIVIGKGFDYVSDTEDAEEDYIDFDTAINEKDDFDEIMGRNEQPERSSPVKNAEDIPLDDTPPDSFSRINPCQADQEALRQQYPDYANCRQVMVELNAGEMLYLPAGWFHEVTSYSNGRCSSKVHTGEGQETSNQIKDTTLSGNCHMALNYWYHPPDALQAGDFDNPYQHDFWRREEERRVKREKT